MSTSKAENRAALATSVAVTDDTLTVDLADGRTLSVPLAWYPRLLHGTPEERARWRLIGQGGGLHWPDLDEDISVASLLNGRPSGENQKSLRAWLDRRATTERHGPVQQSLLPEQFETVTIGSLMEDETVYVVPWAIVADNQRQLWIRKDFEFTREPRGTSHVRVTRSGDFIVVHKETIGDHTYETGEPVPREALLPVHFI